MRMRFRVSKTGLTFTTLWANSADHNLVRFFLYFQENKIWHFMQIAFIGDSNLHEMPIPVSWEE